MITNLATYLAIAEEALEESERLEANARAPRPDGEPGVVVQYDPERVSFKKSLIAITFAGIYLEAMLFIEGTTRLGKAEYMKIDRKHYEEKLKHLGITDSKLLDTCREFREARNDLVHEKAVEMPDISGVTFRTAQRVAKEGVSFVKQISILLNRAP